MRPCQVSLLSSPHGFCRLGIYHVGSGVGSRRLVQQAKEVVDAEIGEPDQGAKRAGLKLSMVGHGQSHRRADFAENDVASLPSMDLEAGALERGDGVTAGNDWKSSI